VADLGRLRGVGHLLCFAFPFRGGAGAVFLFDIDRGQAEVGTVRAGDAISGFLAVVFLVSDVSGR